MTKYIYRVRHADNREYVIGHYESYEAAVSGLGEMLRNYARVAYKEMDEGTKEHTDEFHYDIDKIQLKGMPETANTATENT